MAGFKRHNNPLSVTNPILAREWDYDKNGELTPDRITAGSAKIVWWKCSLGHEWESTPHNRSKGRGCPYCSNQKILKGYNDFASGYPELANEWNYEKNGDLKPYDYTAGSGIKVWWKCDRGHEWKTSIHSRTNGNSGCPFCSGHRVMKGNNDLFTLFPEIAAEWDYDKNVGLSPSDVTSGSNKIVWWKCSQGHEWKKDVYSRTKGKGCPFCSKKRILKGYNDLASVYPQLAKEWNYDKNGDLKPNEISAGSSKKVWWKCSLGHEWESTPNNRSKGRACPYCSGYYVIEGETDFATLYPDLMKEWDYEKNTLLSPSTIPPGTHKSVWWKCNSNHSWKATIKSRTLQKAGCPYCSGLYVVVGETDLATTHPNLLEYWDHDKNVGLTPEMVKAGSKKKVWWKCKNGHSSKSAISDRAIRGLGCPYCSGKLAIEGETDLATLRPDLMSEWDFEKNGDLSPRRLTVGSNVKAWWICKRGHEWQSTVVHRSSDGLGCPYCSGRYAITGETDLLTVNPDLCREWNYERNNVLNITPNSVTSHSDKKVWWKCERGHEWEAVIGSRSRGNGCPYCSSGGTSKPEQAIAYYLSKLFDVKQRVKICKQEIDVYLPQYNIGIEYDGKYYHKNRVEKDAYKTALLTEKGICLIRIVESDHNECQGNIILFNSNAYMNDFEWALRTLIDLLSQITGRTIDEDIDVNIKRDSVDIRTRYALIKKQNSIEVNYPELVEEWNFDKNANLTPDMFTKGSKEQVWWLCKSGHEWQAPIYSRVNGNGCPYCSGRLVSVGKNDLLSVCPELVKEWDYEKNGELLPDSVSVGSNKRVWWKCAEGHEWQVAVSHRSAGSKCPYCQNQKVWPGFNDLATKNPIVSAEWDYDKNRGLKDGKGRDISTPDKVTVSSKQNVWWKCDKGHSWQAMIYTRTTGCGCPICSHRADK